MAASGDLKGKKGKLQLTGEQEGIIRSAGDIRINAVAGSGKTTTLIQYAASRPAGTRILYLAFNKSVKLEAKRKFSDAGLSNVQVETAHSLAFRYVVPRHGYAISQKGYATYEIAEILGLKGDGEKHGEYVLANHISKFMAYFCNSGAARVQELNYADIVSDEKAGDFVRRFYKQIELGTRQFLAKMDKGEIPITHDFYLKKFQLLNPVLPYDHILFDEGQDASPAMLDIFLKQKAGKVIVGDTHQQIYSWRYAVNSLEKAPFASFFLSTSFRFNQAIADLAINVLSWKAHLKEQQPVKITGKGTMGKIATKAIIARTNLGLLLKAINFITENRAVKHLYFEGNIHSYTYADDGASLYDVLNLYNNQPDRVRDKLIRSLSSMEDLEEYIEKTEDVQLAMMVEIVKEYGNEIPSLIQLLKSKHVGDEEKDKAEMVFSTVHRSKGMEYDSVELVDDFMTEEQLIRICRDKKSEVEAQILKWNEEINLLYVAITRARSVLRIPETLVPADFPAHANIRILPVKKEVEKEDDSFKAVYFLQKGSDGAKKKKPTTFTPSFVEKRRQQKNTFTPWTPDTEAELEKLFRQRETLAYMADYFGRNKGSIYTKLKKMGLIREE